jgi:hypothetical protein
VVLAKGCVIQRRAKLLQPLAHQCSEVGPIPIDVSGTELVEQVAVEVEGGPGRQPGDLSQERGVAVAADLVSPPQAVEVALADLGPATLAKS